MVQVPPTSGAIRWQIHQVSFYSSGASVCPACKASMGEIHNPLVKRCSIGIESASNLWITLQLSDTSPSLIRPRVRLFKLSYVNRLRLLNIILVLFASDHS